jgi:hypothetical protein
VGVNASRFNRAKIVKAITLGSALILAILAAPTNAAQAGDHAKSMLGNYECRDGSVSSVAPMHAAQNKTYSGSNPYIQMTVASTAVGSSVEPRWWNEEEKTWKEERTAQLRIKQIDTDTLGWTIHLEGSFPDWPSLSTVAGHLSLFTALYDKPVLILAQYSAVFARAGAFVCDRI